MGKVPLHGPTGTVWRRRVHELGTYLFWYMGKVPLHGPLHGPTETVEAPGPCMGPGVKSITGFLAFGVSGIYVFVKYPKT